MEEPTPSREATEINMGNSHMDNHLMDSRLTVNSLMDSSLTVNNLTDNHLEVSDNRVSAVQDGDTS